MKKLNNYLFLSILIFGFNSCSVAPEQTGENSTYIAVSKNHPGYWHYKGKDLLLLNGSVEDNLFQIDKLEEHLNLLQKSGGNYVRNTMSSRDEGNVWPFMYTDSLAKYDLREFNPEYWQRFNHFLELANERDIFVQIELWATFDFYRNQWKENPFNPKNNINYTANRVKIDTIIPTHPTWCENAFFRSIPMQDNNMPVLEFQQKYIEKLLDISLNYGNVLYCMDNETSVTAEWGKFWSEYVKKKALEKGVPVQTTEMWDPHDLNHLSHRESFDHPELYSFVEISQNNHQRGQNHWDNGLKQMKRLKDAGNFRPVTNVKVYGNEEGGHGGGSQNGLESFIRAAFFGSSAVRFHRPNSGLGLSETAQAVIKSTRMLTDSMAFFDALPANNLLSEREDNEAYLRANPGSEYAIFLPKGENREVILQLENNGEYSIQWIDILEVNWTEKERIQVQENTYTISPPDDKNRFVLIKKI